MQVRFLLWINEIGKSIRVFIKLMDEFKIEDTLINSHIRLFLLLLIAREQYNSAFNLFKEDKLQLKDRFKPIYYALMRLNGNENELLKMGDELKETVIEVIEEILEMREKYSKPPVEGEIVWE